MKSCIRKADFMPKIKSNRILVQVSVPTDSYQLLRRAAFDEGVTVNQYLLRKGVAAAKRKRR